MPAAMEYLPDDKELQQAAADELLARRVAHNTAWAYYEGQHRKQLVTRRGEPDDNVVVNLVREAIDRTVAFLVPKFPTLELDELQETEPEAWLRKAWQIRGGATLLSKMAKNGALDGHVFVRLLPVEKRPARVIVLNPANMLAWWRGDDYEDVLWYSNYWYVGKTEYRQDFVRTESGWTIFDYAKSSEYWTKKKETAWDWPMAPIIEWQHLLAPNRFYGNSEMGNRALNDRVNKVASDIARILRFHASPRTVGTGFEADEVVSTAIDNLWTIANPEAKVYNIEMQSDLVSSMSFLDFLASSFRAEQRVVVLKGDVRDFQRVTSVAVRTIFMDALGKLEELHRNYEGGVSRISQGLMVLDGLENMAESNVIVHWPDPLPSDPLENVTVIEKERTMELVSKETASRELGRDWPLEEARMAEEIGPEAQVMERMLRGETLTPGPSPAVR